MSENPSKERKLCECGCGQAVKPGNRFLKDHSARRTGPSHPCWKGKRKDKKLWGYVHTYEPSNPMAGKDGYVAVRRKVMAEHIGRPLTKLEEVHHINHQRDDNRIENLMLFASRAEHLAYHAAERRRKRQELV